MSPKHHLPDFDGLRSCIELVQLQIRALEDLLGYTFSRKGGRNRLNYFMGLTARERIMEKDCFVADDCGNS